MFWVLKKLSETETDVEYNYSRDNHNLEGHIVFDKRSRRVTIFDPDVDDAPKMAPLMIVNVRPTLESDGWPDDAFIDGGDIGML